MYADATFQIGVKVCMITKCDKIQKLKLNTVI